MSDSQHHPIVDLFRRGAAGEFGDFGATVTTDGPFPRGLGARPELLTEQPDGRRVYRVTPKQCRQILKRHEAEIAEYEDSDSGGTS